jgi:DNA polymerase-4
MFRVILHIDMDAFYASVEQRDQPGLKGRPVIVGAPPTQRGVVCAASYEARRYGVKSAMPSATAARLCPNGIFVRPRSELYAAESEQIMKILREQAGPLVQEVSIDEAYVDVSDRCQGQSHDESIDLAVPIAVRLKEAIRTSRNLTASVGVGPNKLLAKIASDYRKPDGLTVVHESTKAAFLRPLPLRSLYGVGPATEQRLNSLGMHTIGDLQDYKGDLRSVLGSWATELRQFAFGEDSRPLDLSDEVKSIGAENTFIRDTDDRPTLRACLRAQAAEVAERLNKHKLAAHTVQVKVRYGDFTTLTRQLSLDQPVCKPAEIYRIACWLLARHRLVNRPLRLLGLSVSGLAEITAEQLWLPLPSAKLCPEPNKHPVP